MLHSLSSLLIHPGYSKLVSSHLILFLPSISVTYFPIAVPLKTSQESDEKKGVVFCGKCASKRGARKEGEM